MDFRVDKKVVIDAYRGGDDVGSSANGIVEKDFNLEISKYIYDRLKDLGVVVSITRSGDETLDMNSRVNRIKSFYGSGSDVIVISNAINSSSNGGNVVYALRNSNALAEDIARELEKVGIDEVNYYQRRLPSDTSKDYNQLIRDTSNNQSLIIYYGNISNSNEASFLKNNVEELGEAVVIAIADYLGINYSPVNGGKYYVVKKGDSLYSIANKYNTTVSELKELNNLGTNNLSINQILKIPSSDSGGNTDSSSSSSNTYIVKSGDTLYGISKKFGLTVDELKKLNNLSSNILSIGQKLNVGSSMDSDDYVNYKVVSGDSLYSIAKRYNTTVNVIKDLNNLSSNLLSIGQVLKIPSGSDNYITYKVVSGDSLYSIAKKYNTSVNEIKSLNNLSSNLLSIGKVLKIPK